ncbi:DUF6782 family putative metallopeptidase [Tabrizicola caldifontis]|uniref:DUF6782 family putative metallopeptidase n=1 Tax=Tabrizicola caldifontis TaxID=2528036 RepID=UPI0010822730|nr:DUF6782 family putative metallopeptidase [Rhodobacter sp. YIM 73028]
MTPAPGRLAGLAICGIMLGAGAGMADAICLSAPYEGDQGSLPGLLRALKGALAPHPSLARTLAEQAPTLCLDDSLFSEQAYFEPATNRIVLRGGLEPGLQLAILIHEIRHVEQLSRGDCPTIETSSSEYIRSRLAMEADAAAMGIHVAWGLREAGQPEAWEALRNWPTHEDLATRYEAEMTASGDEVRAIGATFAQWFEQDERRGLYANAICANYLDALDREKHLPGTGTLPADFAVRLCVMPDGRPYDCVLPP